MTDFEHICRKFVSAFIEFKKPLICVCNGSAVGVAVTTMALCDVVYAKESVCRIKVVQVSGVKKLTAFSAKLYNLKLTETSPIVVQYIIGDIPNSNGCIRAVTRGCLYSTVYQSYGTGTGMYELV